MDDQSLKSPARSDRAGIVAAIDRRRREEGRSLASLVAEYGISTSSYYLWRREGEADSPGQAFRPVAVTALVPAARGAGLSVVSPGGYRVEGLSVEDAARLLRALG
jgi:hypothetical protein